jgi:hypothetical protein
VSFCSGISVPPIALSPSCAEWKRNSVNPQMAASSTAIAAPESLTRLDAELLSKGRSVIPITVEIYDESGVHTLSATFDWFIRREKKSDEA